MKYWNGNMKQNQKYKRNRRKKINKMEERRIKKGTNKYK